MAKKRKNIVELEIKDQRGSLSEPQRDIREIKCFRLLLAVMMVQMFFQQNLTFLKRHLLLRIYLDPELISLLLSHSSSIHHSYFEQVQPIPQSLPRSSYYKHVHGCNKIISKPTTNLILGKYYVIHPILIF